MAQPGGEQVQVQIKADEKELVGQFSNLVMFHHTAEEFTVHFIYVFPECSARQAGFERDCQPGTRQAHPAGARGECPALRNAVWPDSRSPRADPSPQRGLRAVGRRCKRLHPASGHKPCPEGGHPNSTPTLPLTAQAPRNPPLSAGPVPVSKHPPRSLPGEPNMAC